MRALLAAAETHEQILTFMLGKHECILSCMHCKKYGGPPLRLPRKPDSKAGMRKLRCSDVICALSQLMQIIVALEL